MNEQTPITAPNTHSLQFAHDAATGNVLAAECATNLYNLAPTVNIDSWVLFVQEVHETDFYNPALRPVQNNNFAGIGITASGVRGAEPATVREGVALHVACMAIAQHGDMGLPLALEQALGESSKAFLDDVWRPKYRRTVAPRVKIVDDLNIVYQDRGDTRATWAMDPQYEEGMIARHRQLERLAKGNEVGSTPIIPRVTFGRVPQPPIVELICSKPFEGAGFYRVQARDNVGVCEHITDGHGSIEFYHQFFSTGGERANDALVDFVIGRDGRIGMLNDWRGTRAPWANGNKLGMEGDGPRFYQTFGVAGIDQRLVSIEHEGFPAEVWPEIQWDSAVHLDAWLFDQMGVRFDAYPVHQKYGCVTHMLHSEFTNKGGNTIDECPGRYLKNNITKFQDEVRELMRVAQTADVPVPDDAPEPPIDTAAIEPAWFAHGLRTRTDQHDSGNLYQYLERRFTVAKNRKSQKRVEIGKDALIVDVLTEGEQLVSAFVTRIDDLDWVLDQKAYAYQLNALSPKVSLPLKPRT